MKIKLPITCLLMVLMIHFCRAQTNNTKVAVSEGNHDFGVRSSIVLSNFVATAGSQVIIQSEVQNDSTNLVFLGDCIVLLTDETGKAYQLTPFEDEDNGVENRGLKPNEVRKWSLKINLDRYYKQGLVETRIKFEPGNYILKTIQYCNVNKFKVESNLLKLQIK
jgi:hypothetical protein